MHRLLLVLMCVGLLTGCASSTAGVAPAPTPSHQYPFDLLTVHMNNYQLGAWPDPNGPMPHAKTGPRDSTGVRMVEKNGKLYNAPVIEIQDGDGALLNYAASKNPDDLALAEKDAQRMIDIRVTNAATGDAWWFPYPFDYNLYSDPHDTTIAPWYSGMAQGEAVFLFTRLFEVTGDAKWKDAADHAFHSLLYPLTPGENSRSRPWATLLDSNGYFWIEEWTTPKVGDDTVNGFGFATYGVIEYAHEFHDAEAAHLADVALTTYLYAAQHARHPGGPSSYSLSHMAVRYTNYHKIVTGQLQVFAAVTGDAQYNTLAQEFYQDYH